MNTLISLYIASLPASIISNLYQVNKCYHTVKKESYRNLKYRKNLSANAKGHLKDIKADWLYDIGYSFVHSIIPLENFLFSVETIVGYDELYELAKKDIDDYVENANKEEDMIRTKNVAMLKSIREKLARLDDETSDNLGREDFRLSNLFMYEIIEP